MFAWVAFLDSAGRRLFPVAADLFALRRGGGDRVASWCKAPIGGRRLCSPGHVYQEQENVGRDSLALDWDTTV